MPTAPGKPGRSSGTKGVKMAYRVIVIGKLGGKWRRGPFNSPDKAIAAAKRIVGDHREIPGPDATCYVGRENTAIVFL